MSRLIAFLLLLAASPLGADQNEDPLCQELLAEADAIFEERTTPGQARAALEMYEKILALDPDFAAPYWRIARVYLWMVTYEDPGDNAIPLLEEGIAFAKLGIERSPDTVEPHFWLGALYGRYAEIEGILQGLHMLPYIREQMARVIELDDTYLGGAGYRVLGRLQHQVPAIKGGDDEEAIRLLQKAIEVGPQSVMNHRFLAEVYIDEGETEKAKAELEKVLEMPSYPGYDPECADERKKARLLLEEL